MPNPRWLWLRSEENLMKRSCGSALSRHFACIVVALASMGTAYAQSPTYSRLEIVSGDRQIAVNTVMPPNPYKVRAVDSAGNPVAGVRLFIGPENYTGWPLSLDEFGFRGFNRTSSETSSTIPPEYFAVTDSSGVATVRGAHHASAPAAFLIVAASSPVFAGALPQVFLSAVMAETQPAGTPTVVVEYFHNGIKHYFNTLLQNEIDRLEAGAFAGWSRSTGSFIAYASAQDAPAGTVPVCRFFSSKYTAHFYTADPTECQTVIDRWPDVWTLETRNAFYIYEPDKESGQCAPGLMPVYRLYSTRSGPNHRYVTDRSLRDVMVSAGWSAEGYGPDAVMLCTPR